MQIRVIASFLFVFLLIGLVSAERGSDKLRSYEDHIAKRLLERHSGDNKNIDQDKDISCDDLKNNVSCERLHQIFVTCADKIGLDRGMCLRKETHQDNDKESKRDYLVVLLSDLQKRVERANEKDKINDTQAAQVIAKIAEIKDSILNGDSKDTIKSELKDLKELWKSIKDTIKESDSESENKSLESGNSQDNGAGSDDDSQDNNSGEDSSSDDSQDDNGGDDAN